jgi:hypothetical protein
MKSYDFTSMERELGRVVFALAISRKPMSERIIIGKENEVRRILNGGDGEAYYDETRPLGSLLMTFESDKNHEWNSKILTMQESYQKVLPLDSSRWKMVKPVSDFLKEKYKSGEPSVMFAAIRSWEIYLGLLNKQRHVSEKLSKSLFMLYKPFTVYGEFKPWQNGARATLSVALQDDESVTELWYPVKKRPFETVVNASSFLPIIFYYMNKIDEWRLVFQQCKICEKYFVATSRHYELCSKNCRKDNSKELKREFDVRARNSKLEQHDKSSYYYWDNRLRKLKTGKNAMPDKAPIFKAAQDAFRKEAVKRKAAVKRGEVDIKIFTDWLIQQQIEADRLMDELTAKTD